MLGAIVVLIFSVLSFADDFAEGKKWKLPFTGVFAIVSIIPCIIALRNFLKLKNCSRTRFLIYNLWKLILGSYTEKIHLENRGKWFSTYCHPLFPSSVMCKHQRSYTLKEEGNDDFVYLDDEISNGGVFCLLIKNKKFRSGPSKKYKDLDLEIKNLIDCDLGEDTKCNFYDGSMVIAFTACIPPEHVLSKFTFANWTIQLKGCRVFCGFDNIVHFYIESIDSDISYKLESGKVMYLFRILNMIAINDRTCCFILESDSHAFNLREIIEGINKGLKVCLKHRKTRSNIEGRNRSHYIYKQMLNNNLGDEARKFLTGYIKSVYSFDVYSKIIKILSTCESGYGITQSKILGNWQLKRLAVDISYIREYMGTTSLYRVDRSINPSLSVQRYCKNNYNPEIKPKESPHIINLRCDSNTNLEAKSIVRSFYEGSKDKKNVDADLDKNIEVWKFVSAISVKRKMGNISGNVTTTPSRFCLKMGEVLNTNKFYRDAVLKGDFGDDVCRVNEIKDKIQNLKVIKNTRNINRDRNYYKNILKDLESKASDNSTFKVVNNNRSSRLIAKKGKNDDKDSNYFKGSKNYYSVLQNLSEKKMESLQNKNLNGKGKNKNRGKREKCFGDIKMKPLEVRGRVSRLLRNIPEEMIGVDLKKYLDGDKVEFFNPKKIFSQSILKNTMAIVIKKEKLNKMKIEEEERKKNKEREEMMKEEKSKDVLLEGDLIKQENVVGEENKRKSVEDLFDIKKISSKIEDVKQFSTDQKPEIEVPEGSESESKDEPVIEVKEEKEEKVKPKNTLESLKETIMKTIEDRKYEIKGDLKYLDEIEDFESTYAEYVKNLNNDRSWGKSGLDQQPSMKVIIGNRTKFENNAEKGKWYSEKKKTIKCWGETHFDIRHNKIYDLEWVFPLLN